MATIQKILNKNNSSYRVFIHVKDNQFRIKPISRQESDFDPILRFMQDKNLFSFWKQEETTPS